MRLLIDSNVLIPLEPTGLQDVTPTTQLAADLVALASRGSHQILVHPDTRWDLARDRDPDRRDMREFLQRKYNLLREPPDVGESLERVVGTPRRGTNDWVDNRMLAAVEANAVNYLVTEDRGIHRKARSAGLSERIATVAEAISILHNLFDQTPSPPPAVRNLPAHQLNENDAIFDGLREDYPAFDDWLKKVKLEERESWVIESDGQYAGVSILKREDENFLGLQGKVLKICTLKISAVHRGKRYGELLLKAIFQYAFVNRYPYAYVTLFDHHTQLINLFEDFGFVQLPQMTPEGELVMVKAFMPRSADDLALSPLDFHVKFGPPAVKFEGARAVLVPIQPRYHQVLFPDADPIQTLFDDQPFGNAIRKAYLCNSNIRALSSGDVLLFYRSGEARGVTTVGVVERILVSGQAETIATAVGKRTVYSFNEIEEMASKGEILAILFRQATILAQPLGLEELKQHRVTRAAPQTICNVREEGREWLVNRVGL